MKKNVGIAVAAACVLAACATVRQEDLQAWEGQPAALLESHPIFLTMRLVRTTTSDGVEIRNYVNGKQVASCSGGGSIYAGAVSMATYNQFTNCASSFAACNNIFHVKNGVVQRYTPVGTGGARCYTNETVQPAFRGAANIR